ncbi:DNA cytosine methyltransferase [Sphingobium psychrophilum]|uniref:DNA cytosine methyltransferase n=1 Tax=Sphingobium psychrophilum TaxID=2728834 RepID=UPI001F264248|nr:DNA cytosine methyltransferase [Sphingobium psychrophilum]
MQPLQLTGGGQHHGLVTAHIEQANGGPRNTRSAGRDARRPLSTATATGSQQRIVQTTLVEEGDLPPELMERATNVATFLVKYYATDGENEASQSQPVDRPLDTITTKARFAVVTVTINAVTYIIVDIGLRMLTPRELARAQGFPDTYILDPECWYTTEKGNRKFGRLPKAMQISAIGNSVCPPVAHALVAANQPGISERKLAA